MAGPVGIEPTFAVLETDVLPLNYGPKLSAKVWYMASSFLATVESLYRIDMQLLLIRRDAEVVVQVGRDVFVCVYRGGIGPFA
jgi:hypothetical protein